MEVVKETCADGSSSDDNALLRKAYTSAQWRILPILFGLWMLAWVGRSNVAFAKLQMVVDLRFSETVYGLGAGLFFVGYVLFGVRHIVRRRSHVGDIACLSTQNL
jgi:transposase